MAILPAPVWATVPAGTTAPFTVTSGAATWSGSGSTGTINVTADRSILVWGTTAQGDLTTLTNFNIAAGETFNFVQPSGGAVLNKVSAGTNTTATVFNGLGAAAAAINGSLISNGRVIVLSTSGNIIVGAGAQITTGGTVLSTLTESSDFNFTAQGNLALSTTAASNGQIYLGTGTSAASVVGNLSAYAGAVTTNNLSVSGDLVINQTGAGTGLVLTSAGNTTVGGNFSATSNNGVISQGAGSLLVPNGVTTINTGTTGNVAVTLNTATNDFNIVQLAVGNTTVTGGIVTLQDANSIVLGNATNSTVSENLTVRAGGNITTGGTIAVGGTANLIALAGSVIFQNNSTAANLAANATGGVSVSTLGNLVTKTINSTGANTDISIATSNALTIDGAITVNSSSPGNITMTAASINSTTNGTLGAAAAGLARAVTLNATGANSNLVLPGISARTLSVQTAGGSVSQVGTAGTQVITVTGNATVPGAVTINAGSTGSITLNANNSFNGTSSTVNLTGNSISLTATSNITIGNLDAANNLTLNTAPSTFGNGNVLLGIGGGTAASVIRVGGATAISTNGSNVSDDPQATENLFGSITINTMAAGYGQLATNATVTANGSGFFKAPTVTITGNTGGSAATATVTVNTTTGVLSAVTISNGGGGFNTAPTFAFTGGGNSTGDIAGEAATVTLSSGFVTAVATTGVTTTGWVSAPTVVFNNTGTGATTNATATAVVDTATGNLIGINVSNPGAGYTTAPSFTLVGGTNSGQVNPTVSTSIIPKGDVNLTAQANQGNTTYGQFTINAANVSITERTTLNVAAVSGTGITLRSTAGDILINGQQTINNGGDISLRANAGNITQVSGAIAGTSASQLTANVNGGSGNVTLNNTSNVFGTLSYNASNANTTANIISSTSVTAAQLAASNSVFSLQTVGTGSNITISAGGFNGTTTTFNSAGTINLTSNNATNTLNARNLVLIAGDTGANSITQNGASSNTAYTGLNVNGTLTLTTAGGVTLTSNNNPALGNVILSNVTGAGSVIALNSTGNINNVSGTAAGTVTLTSGTVGQNSVPNASTITLGNLTAGNLVARAQNGGTSGEANNLLSNGASGDIRQATNSSLHVENILTAVTFNGGNIVLGNNNNSAGRVQLSTAGALPIGTLTGTTNATAATGTVAGTFAVATTGSGGAITYTEDGTAKLGALQTSGNATIRSNFGGIIEDPANAVALNVGGTLTLLTPNGSVSIGNTTHTAGATTSNIVAMNATAAGSVSLLSNADLVLGNIAANSLTVTANSISQSAPLNIFGLSTFIATNATAPATSGGINLTNVANNFGPISINVTAPNQSVAVSENSTLNLRTVNIVAPSNGTFTATSVNGDILDTGLGGVRLGGNATSPGSGIVTLTATNGNIIIDDPTSDILTTAGVVFNGNNVTLAVSGIGGTTLVLGANSASSVARGNLTANSSLGNIGNGGAISVGGLAAFATGTGNITIDKPNVGFGTLRFTGNQVQIREGGNMDIVTGSTAFGQAQLISGGDITIVPGVGSVTFGNSVAMQATGNITLRQMQAVGQLIISHTGTANLSALSNSTDLNGRWTNDNDLGTGPGPKTDATLAPKP